MSLALSLVPFFTAALAGIVLALLELLKVFQRNINCVLRNRWGWALMGLNALSAIVVYAIIRHGLNFNAGFWTAVVVGVTFPVIIRSRFTFYRQAGEKDSPGLTELSLKLDEVYQALQDWCYTEVNAALAEQRQALAESIRNKLSAKELENQLYDLIASEPMPSKQVEHGRKLESILGQYPDRVRRKHALALFLIEVSTPQKIRRLVRTRTRRQQKSKGGSARSHH